MPKGSPVTKLVNGEIADADVVNQIIEDVGSQGGLIPYDDITNNQETNGSQSIGSAAFPWGSLFINRNANLIEVDPVSNTVSSTVAWNLLRHFINLKDTPSSYTTFGGLAVRVKVTEDGLEFYQPSTTQVFLSSGTFTVPAGVTMLLVTIQSGGGAGGSAGNGDNGGHYGGGGGGGAAGARLFAYPFTVIPGHTYTITVGAGGTPGVAHGGTGNSGGASSFDSISVPGGPGGTGGGDYSSGNPSKGQGGVSPVQPSMNGSTTTGGSQEIPYSANGNGANDTGTSTSSAAAGGGGSPFGPGGNGGVSANGSTPAGSNTGAGGGGGGNDQANPNLKVGGSGIAGFVLIEY